tara:strand:+ start:1356 stop:1955 length:600 start_codon:yes stop_codon:yes gene_type:complete
MSALLNFFSQHIADQRMHPFHACIPRGSVFLLKATCKTLYNMNLDVALSLRRLQRSNEHLPQHLAHTLCKFRLQELDFSQAYGAVISPKVIWDFTLRDDIAWEHVHDIKFGQRDDFGEVEPLEAWMEKCTGLVGMTAVLKQENWMGLGVAWKRCERLNLTLETRTEAEANSIGRVLQECRNLKRLELTDNQQGVYLMQV